MSAAALAEIDIKDPQLRWELNSFSFQAALKYFFLFFKTAASFMKGEAWNGPFYFYSISPKWK